MTSIFSTLFLFDKMTKMSYEDIFVFSFQRLGSIASNVFQSTVQIQLAKIRFTIIIHQISWKGHVWVDVKAEMVYFLPQHVSNFLAHIVSKTTFYCDMSTFQSSGLVFSRYNIGKPFLESSFCVGLVHALFPLAVALIFLTVANQWLFPWKMVSLMTLFFVRHYPKLL